MPCPSAKLKTKSGGSARSRSSISRPSPSSHLVPQPAQHRSHGLDGRRAVELLLKVVGQSDRFEGQRPLSGHR